jgi:hypothetical protein
MFHPCSRRVGSANRNYARIDFPIVFEGWQKTIPNSELAILPIDGYHAAGTDPDSTARVTLDFIARHS